MIRMKDSPEKVAYKRSVINMKVALINLERTRDKTFGEERRKIDGYLKLIEEIIAEMEKKT